MRRHVLLIEDEPNISEAIRFLMMRAGWTVAVHHEGTEAVEAVRRETPDVVVLDMMLPGRSGFDILADLRADPELSGLPVLVLSAVGQGGARDAAERAGANRFMTKPFANSEVVAAITELGGA
jgi:DNA-binding response OmpR family regulator